MENNGKHMINLKNMKKIFDFFVGTFPLCCASYGELLKKDTKYLFEGRNIVIDNRIDAFYTTNHEV